MRGFAEYVRRGCEGGGIGGRVGRGREEASAEARGRRWVQHGRGGQHGGDGDGGGRDGGEAKAHVASATVRFVYRLRGSAAGRPQACPIGAWLKPRPAGLRVLSGGKSRRSHSQRLTPPMRSDH